MTRSCLLTKGGPAQSTESISYLIYKNGMDGGQFGFQSANAVIFFIVIVAFSIIQMKITGKKGGTAMRKTHKNRRYEYLSDSTAVSGLYHRFVPLVYDGDDRL